MSQKKRSVRGASKQHRKAVPPGLLWIVLGGILLVGLAVLVIVAFTPSAPPAAVEVSGAPSLKVDQEKVDLGTVQLGQTVSVSFELANAGDQPLRVTKSPYVEVVEGC